MLRLKLLLSMLLGVAMTATAQVGGRYSNIEVEKTVDVVQPVPGAPVEFTIQVTNHGDYGAEGLLVTDRIEPPLQIPEGRAAFAEKGYYDAATGEWDVGELANGESVELVIPAIIVGDNLPECIVNTAKFDHPQDTTSHNNRSSMAVRSREGPECADINTGLSVSPGRSDSLLGGCDRVRPYSGTVTVINRGPDTARGIEVQLLQNPVIAPNLRFDDEECQPAAPAICRLSALPVGERRRLSFISDEFRSNSVREQRFSLRVATQSVDYDLSNSNRALDLTVEAFSRCEDPDYGVPNPTLPGGGGGCFIATAAYGSYLHPRVQVLRDWRDDVLLETEPGRRFVDFYYRHSPPIADYIAERPWLRAIVRLCLLPIILFVSQPALVAVFVLLLLVLTGVLRRRGLRPSGRSG